MYTNRLEDLQRERYQVQSVLETVESEKAWLVERHETQRKLFASLSLSLSPPPTADKTRSRLDWSDREEGSTLEHDSRKTRGGRVSAGACTPTGPSLQALRAAIDEKAEMIREGARTFNDLLRYLGPLLFLSRHDLKMLMVGDGEREEEGGRGKGVDPMPANYGDDSFVDTSIDEINCDDKEQKESGQEKGSRGVSYGGSQGDEYGGGGGAGESDKHEERYSLDVAERYFSRGNHFELTLDMAACPHTDPASPPATASLLSLPLPWAGATAGNACVSPDDLTNMDLLRCVGPKLRLLQHYAKKRYACLERQYADLQASPYLYRASVNDSALSSGDSSRRADAEATSIDCKDAAMRERERERENGQGKGGDVASRLEAMKEELKMDELVLSRLVAMMQDFEMKQQQYEQREQEIMNQNQRQRVNEYRKKILSRSKHSHSQKRAQRSTHDGRDSNDDEVCDSMNASLILNLSTNASINASINDTVNTSVNDSAYEIANEELERLKEVTENNRRLRERLYDMRKTNTQVDHTLYQLNEQLHALSNKHALQTMMKKRQAAALRLQVTRHRRFIEGRLRSVCQAAKATLNMCLTEASPQLLAVTGESGHTMKGKEATQTGIQKRREHKRGKENVSPALKSPGIVSGVGKGEIGKKRTALAGNIRDKTTMVDMKAGLWV